MDENVAAATSGIQTEPENNSNEEVELVIDRVVGDIERELQRIRDTRPPSTPAPCLYQVPQKLLDLNPAAYNPQILCIGPLHCVTGIGDGGDLKYYDNYYNAHDLKLRYLETFFTRAKQRASLRDFVKLIDPRYMEIFHETHNSPEVKPLLLRILVENAVFIIELFLRFYHFGENDPIFSESLKMHDIQQDLILVENQLPFSVLRDLYDRAFAGNPNFPSFLQLTCHFFSRYCIQNKSIQDIISLSHCRNEYISKLEVSEHFTDLLRTLHIPSLQYLIEPRHIEGRREEGQEQGEYLYNAVRLREVLVEVMVDECRDRNLCAITFESNGELLIPPLRVDEWTESFFRNLMAWEQIYYYPNETYICGYVFLMQYLIKSEEDVDLLVQRRIIINRLGSSKAVVTLFNNLCKHIRVERNPYAGLLRSLDAYIYKRIGRYRLSENGDLYPSWVAMLKRQYFSTPWRGLATIAAVILLVLTLIQTICAIISL